MKTIEQTKEVKKTERKQSLSSYADQIIQAGGTWDEMSEKINKYAEKLGQKQRYSRAQFNTHIKYRKEIQGQEDFLKGAKITDKGIEVK